MKRLACFVSSPFSENSEPLMFNACILVLAFSSLFYAYAAVGQLPLTTRIIMTLTASSAVTFGGFYALLLAASLPELSIGYVGTLAYLAAALTPAYAVYYAMLDDPAKPLGGYAFTYVSMLLCHGFRLAHAHGNIAREIRNYYLGGSHVLPRARFLKARLTSLRAGSLVIEARYDCGGKLCELRLVALGMKESLHECVFTRVVDSLIAEVGVRYGVLENGALALIIGASDSDAVLPCFEVEKQGEFYVVRADICRVDELVHTDALRDAGSVGELIELASVYTAV